MIYAYDLAIQLPVRDIYDTLIMMASINAAKDMYERGQKQMEDFYKNYGDFFSPISSDMDWYENNITGAARNFINELYKNGVDPLKTAEGRSLILLFIHNVPVGEVNKRKQAAAAAQEYIKARGQLEAKGLWNPDYEKFLLGGRTLETWDTSKDGLWTRTSPGEFSDLNAATTNWFNQLKPSYLRTENGYDYFGVSPEAMDKVTASQIPGFIDSNLGRYHYELARRQLAAANIEQTPENIMQRLRDNIRSANSEVLNETRAMNAEYENNLKYKQQVALENLRHQHNKELYGIRYGDGGGGSGTRTNSNGSGSGSLSGHNWDAELYGSIISNLTDHRWHWSEMGPAEFLQANKFIRSNADAWANGINGVNSKYLTNDAYKDMFFNKYTIETDAQSLIGREPRVTLSNSPANQFVANDNDIKRLVSMDDLYRNTEGFDESKLPGWNSTKLMKQAIKNAGQGHVLIDVGERTYGAPMKNSTNITPRQVVTVKIIDDEGNVTQQFEAGYRIGPDSRGFELQEGPRARSFVNSNVLSLQQNPGISSINTVPNVYNTPYTNFGNVRISKKYGDSSQGIKYNGILPTPTF